MPTILAVTEQRDGALRKVSLEVVSAARTLADALGADVHALVLASGAVTATKTVCGYRAAMSSRVAT